MSSLESFFFAHESLYLIPLEELSDNGLSPEFGEALRDRGLFSAGHKALFDAAWALRTRVQSQLAAAAPDSHLPPRSLHVAVATDPKHTRPYYEPFQNVSVLLAASDLDPGTSSPEHAAFQIVLAERLGQTKRFADAWLAALPFLLALEEGEAAGFAAGAQRSVREDRAVALALGEHLAELRREVGCDGVISQVSGERLGIRGTVLQTTRAFVPELTRLKREADLAVAEVVTAYLARQAENSGGSQAADSVCAFLRAERPALLVLGGDGDILWDPACADDTEKLACSIAGIGERAADSLMLDFAAVANASERMLGMLKNPGALRVPIDSLEEAGGVFIHHERRLIAYKLEQPGIDALSEPAPPYHRLLLSARVAHEWGHLAVDAGAVALPEARRDDFSRLLDELDELFKTVYRTASGPARELIEEELRELGANRERPAQLPLARIEDYQANLLSKRVLSVAEMESYVRANIRSLLAEPIAPLRKLARYAYEAQYLGLGQVADPMKYFFACTYFREEFVESELCSEALARELFRKVGELLGLYEINAAELL